MPLIGNKVSEKDIRDWLGENGFLAESAKFSEVELHAIKRPGWLQVFRFEFVGLTEKEQRVHLFGAMRSDERYGDPTIKVYEERTERDQQLEEWSDGLITQRRHRKPSSGKSFWDRLFNR